MAWRLLHIQASAGNSDELEQLLRDAGAQSVTLADARDQPVFQTEPGATPLWDELVISGLFSADCDLDPLVTQLRSLIGDANDRIKLEDLADQDWEKSWMDQYHPLQFGTRLWICPSWIEPPQPDAVTVMLDPGLAFGTGTHPTTALCLQWLDQAEIGGRTVVDYGCGSGVLALAASLLGAAEVIAVDNDPQAIQASEANRALNRIAARQMRCCLPQDIPKESTALPADILLANILSGPLEQLAPRFAELVKPGGELVLSGTLPEQTDRLLEVYAACFDMTAPVEREGWTRLCGRRR